MLFLVQLPGASDVVALSWILIQLFPILSPVSKHSLVTEYSCYIYQRSFDGSVCVSAVVLGQFLP